MNELYDVVAVNHGMDDRPKMSVRIIARSKSLRNAEAIVSMAVSRRGSDEEFFAEVPAGSYADGDKYGTHKDVT